MAYDLLSRLHKSGKYEVAELASYVSDDDPRVKKLPWRVFPVIPSQSNKEEFQKFQQKVILLVEVFPPVLQQQTNYYIQQIQLLLKLLQI